MTIWREGEITICMREVNTEQINVKKNINTDVS